MEGDEPQLTDAIARMQLEHDAANRTQARIAIRVAPGAPASIPVACRHYLQGYCVNGDRCRFLHPPRASPSSAADQAPLAAADQAPPRRSPLAAARAPLARDAPAFVPSPSVSLSLSLSPASSHPFTPPRAGEGGAGSSFTGFAPPRMDDFRSAAGAGAAAAGADFALHPNVAASAAAAAAANANSPSTLNGFSNAFAAVFEDSDDEEAEALLRAASAPRSALPSHAITSSVGAARASSYAAVAAPVDATPSMDAAASSVQCVEVPRWSAPPPPQTSPTRTAAAFNGGPLCRFHIRGECRYGDMCRYVHGLPCHRCGLNVVHPTDELEALAHEEACARDAKLKEGVKKSEHVECGICYEKPVAMKRKFGLLQNCNHAFCLSCIREWRGQDSAYHFGRETVRSCPVCRTESYLVIPSDTYESDANVREQLLHQYQSRLKTIPCKYFDFGRGECPFSGSCMYAHIDQDGNAMEEPERPPLLVSDSGVRVKTHAVLADYLLPRR